MKITLLSTIVLMALCLSLQAQQKAITEFGEEVILYEDGSWKYLNENPDKSDPIPVNPEPYEKGAEASFLLKSKDLPIGVWLNPKKWSFQKAEDNDAAEYEMQLKDGDLYAMLITEKVEIPLQTLRNIAVNNGRKVAPDLKIIEEEYREVNGTEVLLLKMEGSMQGIKVAYLGYYYSSEAGSVQFVTYTSQNLMREFKDTCENLLNGLVEIP